MFYSLSAVDIRRRHLTQLPEMGRTLCNFIGLCSFVLVKDALRRKEGVQNLRSGDSKLERQEERDGREPSHQNALGLCRGS